MADTQSTQGDRMSSIFAEAITVRIKEDVTRAREYPLFVLTDVIAFCKEHGEAALAMAVQYIADEKSERELEA